MVAFPLPGQLVVSGDVLIQVGMPNAKRPFADSGLCLAEVFHLYLDAKRELAMKLAFHTNFVTEGRLAF